jgi:hypothetical protein
VKAWISLLVTIHLVVTLWHGTAHQALAVTLSPAKSAFVLIDIVLAPIAAALLVWTRHFRAALWCFFLAMIGSFLFGVYHHYLLVSPDHVHHLPPGSAAVRSAFITSAALLAFLELASAAYGAFCLRRLDGIDPPDSSR